ncbi:NYN domain-containing protein [Nocardioides nanhaiensis]|uniref:NYN domain-containing protein n=1 Tax=Nocardioides nanhaiensis TaxID=1476871 RepID=A0ABP8W1M2_9ACTN
MSEGAVAERAERRTFVLVDGENIDATLGNSVLGRRPHPEERPRWERVTAFVEQQWGHPVTGLFFLNASNGQLPASFVQALLAMSYRPVPLSGRPDEKVVDVGIQRTLQALRERPEADVVLCSHDADFVADLGALLGGERRLGVIGFDEFMSAQLRMDGVEVLDLEHDVRAFNTELPRTRIIPLDEFDPTFFLR